MLHPAVTEHAVSGFAPRAILSRTVGKFVKGLPEILGTSESPMDATRLTALSRYGSDPTERRQALGIFETDLGHRGRALKYFQMSYRIGLRPYRRISTGDCPGFIWRIGRFCGPLMAMGWPWSRNAAIWKQSMCTSRFLQ